MTRNAFIASLNELNDALLKMAVLTEKALADAIDALERDDNCLLYTSLLKRRMK